MGAPRSTGRIMMRSRRTTCINHCNPDTPTIVSSPINDTVAAGVAANFLSLFFLCEVPDFPGGPQTIILVCIRLGQFVRVFVLWRCNTSIAGQMLPALTPTTPKIPCRLSQAIRGTARIKQNHLGVGEVQCGIRGDCWRQVRASRDLHGDAEPGCHAEWRYAQHSHDQVGHLRHCSPTFALEVVLLV